MSEADAPGGGRRSTGRYLVLEGGDGSGKSCQSQRLAAWLARLGQTVKHLREPGSTATGEALRQLLLDPGTGTLAPLTEALLFSAARLEMLRDEVRPALRAGQLVLCERCYLSTLVYQGFAGALPVDLLRQVTGAVHGDLWPDRVFVLDVDEATRQARATGAGKADRIEARGPAFHQAVRQGYLEMAEQDPLVEIVDARGGLDAVQELLQARTLASFPELAS